MREGLLWYDPDGKLQDRIRRASRKHLAKYGRWPNTCQVHPSELTGTDEAQVQVDGALVRVLPSKTVSRCYYWIGRGEQPA